MKRQVFDTEVGGRKLTVEFSPLAPQTNSSLLVTYGGTVVLANVVMSKKPKEGAGYFPLIVDYEEKFYAAGRILGSRFMRREARPSEEAILVSRLIDRTIRPLFDQRMRYDIQLVVLALSVDEENDPDIPAVLGASLALLTSDIPWQGPVSAIRVGKVNDALVLNPSHKERGGSLFDIVVSGKEGKINMLEGKANIIKDEDILPGIQMALEEIEKLNAFQKMVASKVGKEKFIPDIYEAPQELVYRFNKEFAQKLKNILSTPQEKIDRQDKLGELKGEWLGITQESSPDTPRDVLSDIFDHALDEIIHENILKHDLRPDGRKLDEIRELFSEVGILPRTHGSGLFFRGDTHILSVVTLGAPGDVLLIEGMEIRTKKHFIHHYNFPPFSVGEIGRMGAPGRREIGHGALAEKALEAIIPDRNTFPYTIRLVSETLSSNGSSSMGSVSASSLALMDAGVPIKHPVSGIAMGLMISQKGSDYKVLTDIQGPEDHHGDMDLKVAGTEEGITALQMDVKIEGITLQILRDTLRQAGKARKEILATMQKTISRPRESLSPYAPRIITHTINPDKIRDVVGPGGKTINMIINETGAEIDIEQDGTIFITGTSEESALKALEKIKELTREYLVGETFHGKVTRLFDFGAMVEVGPKQEGLVHVSEIAPFRVGRPSDMLNVGDEVPVKIISIDNMGRINLSIKAVATLQEKSPAREKHPPGPRGTQHRPKRTR